MDKYTATEQAFKHGYEKGYADGERNAVLLCKNCQFSTLYETSGKYHCRSQMGLNRTVHPNEFCSWGEKRYEKEPQQITEQTLDALNRMGDAVHG